MTREEKWDRRLDYAEEHPTRSVFKVAGWLALIMVALIIAFSVGRFAFGWFGATADIFGPANVKAQYAAVIEDWNAMEAAAENACAAKDVSRQGPTFLEDPAFAYKAKYRQIAVDYNRRQANFFEAKEVGPSGYASRALTLPAMEARVCR